MSNRRRHDGNRENPTDSNCLGVFGLSLYTTERELEKEFSRFGPLEKVQVVLDGKVSKGFFSNKGSLIFWGCVLRTAEYGNEYHSSCEGRRKSF